jgi:hypothetical protein
VACRRTKAPPVGMACLGPTCLDISVAMHQRCPCHVEVQEFREPPSEKKESNPTLTVRQLPARRQFGVCFNRATEDRSASQWSVAIAPGANRTIERKQSAAVHAAIDLVFQPTGCSTTQLTRVGRNMGRRDGLMSMSFKWMLALLLWKGLQGQFP